MPGRAAWKDVAVPKPYPTEFREDVMRVAQNREPAVASSYHRLRVLRKRESHRACGGMAVIS
ncbi:hypothetical protein GCM10023087_30700 [Microbacterium rhizosphaerae]